jgi:hypothetical protein
LAQKPGIRNNHSDALHFVAWPERRGSAAPTGASGAARSRSWRGRCDGMQRPPGSACA